MPGPTASRPPNTSPQLGCSVPRDFLPASPAPCGRGRAFSADEGALHGRELILSLPKEGRRAQPPVGEGSADQAASPPHSHRSAPDSLPNLRSPFPLGKGLEVRASPEPSRRVPTPSLALTIVIQSRRSEESRIHSSLSQQGDLCITSRRWREASALLARSFAALRMTQKSEPPHVSF
jgi:hypothetical protein